MTEEIIEESEDEEEYDDELIPEVKIIRLVSGVDIVGFCFEEKDSNLVTINSPMVVKLDRNSGEGLGLEPWLPVEILEFNMCTISYSDVLTVYYPRDDFIEYFVGLANQINETIKESNEKYEAEQEAEESEIPAENLKKVLH